MRYVLRSMLLALLALAVPARAEQVRLVLLHTTDVHAHVVDEGAGRRSLARLATLVREARADSLPTLLLDAGDALFGARHARAARTAGPVADPVVAAMNAMGYVASVAGNHEFDRGLATFDRMRRDARFPFLAANLDHPDPLAAFEGGIVRTAGGIRVGIVGVTTPALGALVPRALLAGVGTRPAVEAARREVARLRNACDVIVLLAHTGLGAASGAGPADGLPDEHVGEALAHDVAGVDAVILGHSHVVIPGLEREGTIVAQAGHGQGLGRIDLTLTRSGPRERWKVAARTGSFIAIRDTTAADPEVLAGFAPLQAAAERELDRVIGRTAAAFASPAGRAADGPAWRLLHDVQREAGRADVSLSALFDPAAGLPAGDVRLRDVLALYPYENTLVTLRVTGAELREALEHAAAGLAAYSHAPDAPWFAAGGNGANFDMAAGVTYAVDPGRPVGSRIVDLRRGGTPLAPGDSLTLAVNSYRAAGGGGFAMLARAPRVRETEASIPELIVAWLGAHRGTGPSAEQAWTLVPAYAGRRERPLVDRLVRLGSLPAETARARGRDASIPGARAAADLGQALGWGAGDAGAIAGLERRRVLRRGEAARVPRLTLGAALDWCERAARAGRWPLDRHVPDLEFRRGLLTGVGDGLDPLRDAAHVLDDTQWLGILANFRWPELRVLETTDFHGAIQPGRDRRSGRPTGGSVALAAAIAAERAGNPEGTVLLDGGDCFQGTMISNLPYGRPVVEQMNALGYSAMAVGNHEFDWSLDTLVVRVHEMRFAALAANMRERRSGRRPAWARGDTAFVRRGVRMGVVGLAYPGTPRVTLPAHVATLRFEDDSTWAARTVPALRKAGAGVVLGVGHIPAETDSGRRAHGDLARLARGVRGVDAWFGGHSHNVVDDVIGTVPVMIAGSHGQWLAVCDLVVDAVANRVVEHRTRMRRVWGDEPGPDSAAWQARVRRWDAGIAPIAAEVIGRTEQGLDRERPEATIGNFVAEAMRHASGAAVALQNPGGLRANLDAGPITRGEIYEIMPFDNTIVTMDLTGAELRLALEQSLGYGRITQVSGIRYVVDSDAPRGERVREVTLADGSPLDPTRTLRVAANNFMASGGDNYDALGKGRNREDTGLVIRGAMEALVRERCAGGGALGIARDGRIRTPGR